MHIVSRIENSIVAKVRRVVISWINGFSAVIVFIGLWWFATSTHLVSPLFVSSPVDVYVSMIDLVKSGILLTSIRATLFRLGISLLLSMLVGIPLGVLLGLYKKVQSILGFLIDFFRSLPATALFPLFILILGIGDSSKIALVVFSSTLIIAVSTSGAVSTAKERCGYLLDRFAIGCARQENRTNALRMIIIPSAMPEIVNGLRVSLSISLILVIVTEMLFGTETGLGGLIMDSQLFYHIPEAYSAIIVTGLIGYLFNLVFVIITNRFFRWKAN